MKPWCTVMDLDSDRGRSDDAPRREVLKPPRSKVVFGTVSIGLLLLTFAILALGMVRGRKKFTVIVLPDTQYYSESYPGIFDGQTSWIVAELHRRNVVFVSHLGDIVENWDREPEWENADRSMGRLDGVVAYGVLPGNHDMSTERQTTFYQQTFPESRFAGSSWFGDDYPPGTNRNSYQLFSAGGYDFLLFQVGNDDYLVLNLEFCPTSDVIVWANQVLETHADRRAIVSTHGYMDVDAERHLHSPSGGCTDPDANAQYIWDDLIYPNPNVFLVLSGHEYELEGVEGEARRVDLNVAGWPVYQLLSNYQKRGHGGAGWLRILGFVPKENAIYVRTYSTFRPKDRMKV